MTLTVITTAVVILSALLAGSSLWLLRSLNRQAARLTATQAVIDKGCQMTQYISCQEDIFSGTEDGKNWKRLSETIRSLHTLEGNLQYVSVSQGSATIFHEQTSMSDRQNDKGKETSVAPIIVGKSILNLGNTQTPVVVFRKKIYNSEGKDLQLEIGIKKVAVGQAETEASNIISSMFRLSLISVIVAFGLNLMLVIWMIHRENTRKQQRQKEEHLAFAGMLANGIVHDFRNPMSAMKLDVQMLNREAAKGMQGKSEKITALAERIKTTMDRMDGVFQEFFRISRPTDGETENCELSSLIKDCISIISARLEHKKIQCNLIENATGIHIRADISALRRALVNILTNAEQHSKDGSTITVDLSLEHGRAVTKIIDSGPGISDTDKQKIFEMFYSTRPGGTGLGLFIAKTAIEKAGGSIQALDADGGGTCFKVCIPIIKE